MARGVDVIRIKISSPPLCTLCCVSRIIKYTTLARTPVFRNYWVRTSRRSDDGGGGVGAFEAGGVNDAAQSDKILVVPI